VKSETGKLSCNKTALKRCTSTEILWKRKLVSLASPEDSDIIIIIMERKDLGGVISKDCKDTLQTLKTVTKRECDAK